MRTAPLQHFVVAILALGCLSSSALAEGKSGDRVPGHWPQWRGPLRTNVSAETGLLKRWPENGPPLAWKAVGLGDGAASVAVAGGRVYTLGYRDENEWLTALEETTGKTAWSVRVGPVVRESPVMRWLSQRTPTVDEDRIYAVTARGELVCLKSTDGKELWRKNYPQDFEGKSGAWGFCDRPLVDGDRLICTPGGATATVVALDKKSGAVVWRCAVPGGIRCGYAATVVATIGTLRHYVAFLHGAVVGVSARDGKLLWRYDSIANLTGNNYSPIIRGDHVFCASGYGKGIALLKLIPDKDGLRVEEVYFVRMPLPPWHETTVLVNDHVYLGSTRGMSCVELATGKVVWEARGAVGGTVSVTCADGRLYLRAPDGKVALVEASPKEYLLKGIFNIPGARPKPGSTAPVVAAGRLYLRDDDGLFCYDVKEGATAKAGVPAGQVSPKPVPRPREERGGQDVFVPTPQDVVERMLELARVKRNDVVYDLGCGDGRIVVTAARKYGCKAVGYDIDPECVKTARERVAQADMGRLVAIEQKDFFTADIGKADVVTLYLLPRTMERLVPQLNKLRPGSRIVSHAAAIPGYRPEQVVTIKSSDDNVEHRIYLWTVPLKKDGPEK